MSTTHTTDSTPILRRIVEARRRHIRDAKRLTTVRDLLSRIDDLEPPREFRAAVSPGKTDVAVVAELKKASPSRGVIRSDFRPAELARCLAQNGAAALSVLTEPDFFLGDPAYLEQVRTAVGLPLLRKDFIVDPYQVYESRVLGADALLLIVKIVQPGLLADLIGVARDLGMDALVEINTQHELETALSAGADTIGINNRNLETFGVDRDTAVRLSRHIPDEVTPVAMSGIRSRADIDECARAGIRSFLIGETLMRIPDIGDMGRTLGQLAQRPGTETL
ncbi:MAG: indole-3-glycerol phosphate synthase TrpC [Deltaproteobacteria bacterium]|nr:indole-3-glycerol phosphate synthase TrpC [Candidatus Zymogenaceae bacterium]